MTNTTATKPLSIIDHFYNLEVALHDGGDPAVEIYETQTLLTDYPNGAAVRVFDCLGYAVDDQEPTWDDVKETAEWLKVEHTPQLVADIRALCEDTVERNNNSRLHFTPYSKEEEAAELWVMRAEALLAN